VAGLFESGRIVDLILAIVAAEAAWLAWRGRARGAPWQLANFSHLLAGAFLLLALRAALTEAWWGWIGLWLAAAGLAQIVDLRQRLRR